MSSAAIDKCAACGTEGVNLKSCNACHMVKYCNRDCQISHRKQHKKACKKRAAELYDEQLFKEVEPEECPICLLPLPHRAGQTTMESCCGKRICNGCIYAMDMSEGKDLCAFCRTPPAMSREEHMKRIKNLMDKGNSRAFNMLGLAYKRGDHGLAQDYEKAHKLYLEAGKLGCADAYNNLGNSYNNGTGVDIDHKKAKYYYELAAMKGCVTARHNLGCSEGAAGNERRAMKHFMNAAKAGYDSLNMVKKGFKRGLVTKEEYANTLRAYQKIQDEMKSDERDKAASEMRN